uniref:Uncharacterized protein n=1 Tax=Arundo donax TaxID=35708 RepID=A0A0A8ZAH5_ARUDO
MVKQYLPLLIFALIC